MNENAYIRKAIESLGGLTATAKALRVSNYQTVQQWISTGQVPAKYCVGLEKLSGISRQHFRPKDFDAYWPELKEAENA